MVFGEVSKVLGMNTPCERGR